MSSKTQRLSSKTQRLSSEILPKQLRTSNYCVIELKEPIKSKNPIYYGVQPPVKVTVVKGKVVETTQRNQAKDATILLEDTDQLHRMFSHRVEKLNIKTIKCKVPFLSYNNRSLKDLSYKINSYVGGYIKKSNEIKKNKSKKTKKGIYTKKNKK